MERIKRGYKRIQEEGKEERKERRRGQWEREGRVVERRQKRHTS